MNRLLKVFLALSLPVFAVLLLLLNTRSAQSDLRQQAVLSYVALRRTTLSQPLTIGQYVWASMPQNFRAEMGGETFGNSLYYQMAHSYLQPEPSTVTPSPTATVLGALSPFSMTIGAYLSGRSLPYPPTDLWCVQLHSPDPAAPQVVLAALHQDIYNAEWVVHEVTDPETVLATVGCKFPAQ